MKLPQQHLLRNTILIQYQASNHLLCNSCCKLIDTGTHFFGNLGLNIVLEQMNTLISLRHFVSPLFLFFSEIGMDIVILRAITGEV